MLVNNEKTVATGAHELRYQTFFIEKNTYVVFLEAVGAGTLTIPEESHSDWYELDVTPDDHVEVIIEGRSARSSTEKLLLIHPRSRHHINLNTATRFLGFSLFLHKRLFAESRMEGSFSFVDDQGQRIQKLFELIKQYFAKTSGTPIDDFLLDITRLILAETRRRAVGHHLPDNFRHVTDYIEHNYAHEISIEDLARVGSLSKFHLIRRFKDLFGVPPMQYLTDYRLKCAAGALRLEKGLNIAEIAFSCGFNDLSNFNRRFKAKFALSPREYRRLIGNG